MTPFRIEIPQTDLDDLADRLGRTRWPRQLPGDGWTRGVPVDELRALVGYWRDGFDWRAVEARVNTHDQFVTAVDGADVHFLHVRSGRDDATPLLLTHGWPNSFLEFLDLIPHLTDDFHLVIPSVPGFGFSAPPRRAGWSVAATARLWAGLMRGLGYDRYGVEGGDLGAYVAPEVALAAPDAVVGVYVISGLGFPTEADVPDLTDDERAAYTAMQNADWMTGVDHHALLRAAPQTFAYGWNDSPAAALAWMLQKNREFGGLDPLDRDLLLANTSLYWFTDTFGTSSWPMYDTTSSGWPQGQRAVPTGVYSGPPGFRRLAEKHNRIVHWPEDNQGRHHFVAMSDPESLAADLRRFFAVL